RMFHQITGENKFTEVMRGIDKAFEVGFEQVKVNVVLMKDLNSQELPAFLNWIKDKPIQLRFIELMKTGEMDELFDKH
ncbi:GTP 3',8-cyclase MoaA, partial [Vibrio breoganii]